MYRSIRTETADSRDRQLTLSGVLQLDDTSLFTRLDDSSTKLELEITNSSHPFGAAEVSTFALDYEQFQAALYDLHNRRREAEASGNFVHARSIWLSIAKLKQDVEHCRQQIGLEQMESEKARLDQTRVHVRTHPVVLVTVPVADMSANGLLGMRADAGGAGSALGGEGGHAEGRNRGRLR